MQQFQNIKRNCKILCICDFLFGQFMQFFFFFFNEILYNLSFLLTILEKIPKITIDDKKPQILRFEKINTIVSLLITTT